MIKTTLITALLALTPTLYANDQTLDTQHAKVFLLQQAAQAMTTNIDQNCYNLTLSNLKNEVLYFAAQPNELVGEMNTQKLVSLWNTKKLTHNASIHAHYDVKGQDKTINYIVALSHPRYDAAKNTLQYKACINDPKVQKLTPPKQSSNVTLFIDQICLSFDC